jgi:hypothetical protein
MTVVPLTDLTDLESEILQLITFPIFRFIIETSLWRTNSLVTLPTVNHYRCSVAYSETSEDL